MPAFQPGRHEEPGAPDLVALACFGLGALGPVSEGLFVWTIGLAVIIGFTVWLTSRSA